MVQDRTRPLVEILAGGALGELTREAGRRRTLTERLRTELPPELAEHLVSAATNAAGELVLCMESAAWAARARYALQSLCETPIRVKVSPSGARTHTTADGEK